MITTIVGFIQEYRSEKTVEMLRLLSSPMSTVVRDNKEVSIRSSQLVPGDIVIVIEGDRVAADSILIENHNITTNEAALTGESLPVEKSIQQCISHDTPLHERRNILYAGTMVTSGRGKALVFGTGEQTEVESVSRDKTPFQRKMDQIGRLLVRITIIVSIITILTGIYRGNPLIEILLWGISIAVAAIPEALPAVTTTSLAVEVSRMAKRHAILKTLPSAETLGAVTVICSDKTGTLTKGKMSVRELYLYDSFLDVRYLGKVNDENTEDGSMKSNLFLLAKMISLCKLLIWKKRR